MPASTPPSTAARARLAAVLMRSALAAACCALAPAAFGAGQNAIVTDRPDFVESSDVVGKGRFQIETSIGADRNREGGLTLRTLSMPTLLRIGVSDSMELRIASDGRMHSRLSGQAGPAQTGRGYADVSVGAKWHLMDAQDGMPSVGALVHAELPTGSGGFGGDGVRPSMRVAAEWELPSDMSLGVMPGLANDKTDTGKRITTGIFGVVLGKGWNAHLRTFIELSAPRIARGKDGGSELNLNTGLAWLLNDRCQLDTAVSRGLNARTTDLSFTVGLSLKL